MLWLVVEGSHQRYGRGPREWKMAVSRRESKDEMGTPGNGQMDWNWARGTWGHGLVP